jgi:hypothetical protein
VRILAGSRHRVTGNAIRGNLGLGVNLVGGVENADGVTENDPLDLDGGANNLQNSPFLESATLSDQGVLIAGFLSSAPHGRYSLEFFSSPSCDASGRGEAETYLGSAEVGTDAAGMAAISALVSIDTTTPEGLFRLRALDGQVITATATDSAGSTSELSNCVTTIRTAVTILSFTAVPVDAGIQLAWRFTEDSDPVGFHVLRREGEHRGLPSDLEGWERLTREPIGPAGERGESALTWTDAAVDPGTAFSYLLESFDRAGVRRLFGPASAIARERGPLRLAITPNPAAGGAKIVFDLPSESPVEILLFDVAGRLVRRFPAATYPAGPHAVPWDARDGRGARAPAGVYFVRLRSRAGELEARLVLEP